MVNQENKKVFEKLYAKASKDGRYTINLDDLIKDKKNEFYLLHRYGGIRGLGFAHINLTPNFFNLEIDKYILDVYLIEEIEQEVDEDFTAALQELEIIGIEEKQYQRLSDTFILHLLNEVSNSFIIPNIYSNALNFPLLQGFIGCYPGSRHYPKPCRLTLFKAKT